MVNWRESNNFTFRKFTEEITKNWLENGFDKKETGKWLEVGLHSNDASFAKWLRDVKQKDAECFFDYGDEEELRKEFQSFLAKNIKELEENSDNKEKNSTSSKKEKSPGQLEGISFAPNKWLSDQENITKKDLENVNSELAPKLQQFNYYLINHYLKKKNSSSELSPDQWSVIKGMVWKSIHKNFTISLQREWEKKGFNYEKTKEWINIGLTPHDADFASWLRDVKKRDTSWVLNYGNIKKLRAEYQKYLSSKPEKEKDNEQVQDEDLPSGKMDLDSLDNLSGFFYEFAEKFAEEFMKKTLPKLKENNKRLKNWKENNYPFKKFTEEITKKWIDHGFNKKETREWLESGLQPDDVGFAQWLRDIENISVDLFSDIDEEILRKKYAKLWTGDWKNIHPDFTPELRSEWEKWSFDYERTKGWIDMGFKPTDASKCARYVNEELKKMLENEEIKEVIQKGYEESGCFENLVKAQKGYEEFGYDYFEEIVKEHNSKILGYHAEKSKENIKNWNDDSYSFREFTEELTQEWINCGFNKKETRGWLDFGFQPNDAKFAQWLNTEQYLNEGEEEVSRSKYNTFLDNKELHNAPTDFAPKSQKEWTNYFLNNLEDTEDKRLTKNEEFTLEEFLTTHKSFFLKILRQREYVEKIISEWKRKVSEVKEKSSIISHEVQHLNEESQRLLESKEEKEELQQKIEKIRKQSELVSRNLSKLSKENEELEQLKELVEKESSKQEIYEQLVTTKVYSSKDKQAFTKGIDDFFLSQEKRKWEWEDLHPECFRPLTEEWENFNFDWEEIDQWVEGGLKIEDLVEDIEFFYYCRKEGYNPRQVSSNYNELRKEYNNWLDNISAQEWLDYFYPLEKRKEIKGLRINRVFKNSSLIINDDWINLDYLNCSRKHLTNIELNNLPKLASFIAEGTWSGDDSYSLTKLSIINCPKIKFLNLSYNYLSEFDFLNNLSAEKLTYLNISNNYFSEESLSIFSKFTNLQFLILENNFAHGSLESLEPLKNLQYLDISSTGISSGLEYLPESLEKIRSSSFSTTFLSDNPLLTGSKSSKGFVEEMSYLNDIGENENKAISRFFHKYKNDSQFSQFFGNLGRLRRGGRQYYDALLKTGHLSINKELENYRVEKEHSADWIEIYNVKEWRGAQPFYKQLKKVLNKMGYSSLSEIDKNIFFNVRRGYFQINDKDVFSLLQQVKLIDDRTKFNENTPTYLIGVTSAETEKYDRLESLIRKKIKDKNIKRIDFFPTWFNPNCAIVIENNLTFNKNAHRIWIAFYEPAFGKIDEKINWVKAMNWVVKDREKQEKIIEDFKQSLNAEYPSLSLNNKLHDYNLFTSPSFFEIENVAKKTINFSTSDNPGDYLKPYDIVKRKIDMVGLSHHYAVYLGENEEGESEVVQISGQKEIINRFGDFSDLYARIDSWEVFLKGIKEIEVYRPFIPFKEPELIKKHIDMAVKAKYGKGEYDLLRNNCEHFATMCVYGLGICQQKNVNTANKITKSSDYLSGEATKENNRLFESLEVDKFVKIKENLMAIQQLSKKNKANQDWVSVHQDFQITGIEKIWTHHNFTSQQCKEWIDIGLKPTDADLAAWLRDTVQLTPEQVLNEGDEKELRELFREYQCQKLNDSKTNWTQKINNLKWDLGVAPELLKEGNEWENKLNSKETIKEVEEYAKEILRNIYQIANKEVPIYLQKLENQLQFLRNIYQDTNKEMQNLEINVEIPPK